MADPSKGRGRGLALIQSLRAQKNVESPKQDAPSETSSSLDMYPPPSAASSYEPSIAPSYAPNVLSAVSSAMAPPPAGGGRGKVALLSKMLHKPGGGGDAPLLCPASDVKPSSSAPKSMGRGLKLIQSLRAAQSHSSPPGSSAASVVDSVTDQMAASTITAVSAASSVGKNKYFREIKDTPPVVMKGTTGTPCDVTANYIYLKFEESNVFEYGVKYEPDQDHKHLRFKLLNEHRHLFEVKTFDGSILYVPHRLPDDVTELVSTNPYDDSKVNITIIFNRTRRLSEMIHIYNLLFKHIMSDLELVRFGRQHFNEHAAIQIPQHKLEVWPGYVTAVNEYEGGLMLTLDSTHRVLRTQSVLSYIKDTAQAHGANWKKMVKETLFGSSVMTSYNKKLYRVDAIDDNLTPKSTFERKENGVPVQISYIDYYKKNYNIDIMDWDQPILISRDTKRISGEEKEVDYMICLIPELCQLTGLTDDQRSNFRLMKDVATYTRITPNQRHAAFKQFVSNVLNNESARNRLKGWGLSLAPETIDITARTLPPEALYFGNNVKVPGKPNADWNSDVTKNSVMQAVDIHKWAVLFTDRDKQTTMNFIETVQRCCKPMGITIEKPQLLRLPNDRTDSFVVGLREAIQTRPQIIVVICPSSRDDRYSAIKRVCCSDAGIPSQVINARTIMNQQKVRSITQKILLQINCKLGGTLWHIHIPIKSVMVVGTDSYHDPTRRRPSVCSFVASYTQSLTKWYSTAVFQEKGQEIIDCLKACLVNSLRHFLVTNGFLPDRIIMYRDGVSDGQFKQVQTYEIPQLRLSIQEVEMQYEPKITYVVVQKRINTRIFLKCGPGQLENPAPGTVVDHAITRRDWYDFLIVSQKVNQGTVTPTHYVVVNDDSKMPPDQCQRLTYKLTHLYYNWPGTVRVPAPCQYAHKLAYLVGQNIGKNTSEALADKLFFL
ncbi:piwi-like protein Ago3 [Pieris napi]|uniref:piwi-like protein Ago3 n=1 Tax=Pieris napi TaxID=78633 RepID=UPI001FBADEAA|nr:piwi-like protein Ago3 [Pieris napi]